MLNLDEICALRDKLIMDDSLTTDEQVFMYELLQNQIFERRNLTPTH